MLINSATRYVSRLLCINRSIHTPKPHRLESTAVHAALRTLRNASFRAETRPGPLVHAAMQRMRAQEARRHSQITWDPHGALLQPGRVCALRGPNAEKRRSEMPTSFHCPHSHCPPCHSTAKEHSRIALPGDCTNLDGGPATRHKTVLRT